MPYNVTQNKDDSRRQLEQLVNSFVERREEAVRPEYNEAQLRVDFIGPLLRTFGWDTDNEAGKTQFLREVIQEESIEVEVGNVLTKKNPDYTLRIGGIRKLFVEAKKASIDIERSAASAFQARRYGWSANLGISILTNFDRLVIYDCRHRPVATDQPMVARYRSYGFREFLTHFDELYDLLSFVAVTDGRVDELFSLSAPDLTTFDEYFLQQIEQWRMRLAANILIHQPDLSAETINFLVQRLLNRIVFLRICEDREMERAETLRGIHNYDELKRLFRSSDEKYNSGLFDFIEDNFSLHINLDPDIIVSIFNELYYPESPYNFAVVDPAILSQIYDRYLGSRIAINEVGRAEILEDPEVAASSGVVPTPKTIVDQIVRETLSNLVSNLDFDAILRLRIADICCGSGTFLITVFDYLIEASTLALQHDHSELLVRDAAGTIRLSLKAKRDLLTNCIFGVDINPYAAEVTKFSLLLKLLEEDTSATAAEFAGRYHQRLLPPLNQNIKSGNSLVDDTYFAFNPEGINDLELLYKVRPFNWANEFPFWVQENGFDAIVGNPPYVRIQNIVRFIGEELRFYQNAMSGYSVARTDTFDKYYLFIQRAIQLLKPSGVLGYIVPHKFFIARGGKALRNFVSTSAGIEKIIHFGVTQVFPARSTYTAIIILSKTRSENLSFKRISRVAGAQDFNGSYTTYLNASYDASPWIFLSESTKAIFELMDAAATVPLNSVAEIAVGLQTSLDKVYIFQPIAVTDNTYIFRNAGQEFEVEKEICKPCLYDLTFHAFDTVVDNAQMIFPYRIEARAEPFDEEEMAARFPLTWAYLNHFRDALSRRSINGSRNPKWYQFGRSQSLTRFHNAEKIIWPVLSVRPAYIYDQLNLQFTGGGNGPYYSLFTNGPYSPLYLMGLLVHPVIEARVRSGASEFRGAYYSHGKQFIERIPVKTIDFNVPEERNRHDNIVELVRQIITAKAAITVAGSPDLREVEVRRLNFLVTSLTRAVNVLYNITEADVATVLRDPSFAPVEE